MKNESMDWEINKLFVHKDFNLLNLLTGNVKRKELEKQMLSIWRIVYNMRQWTDYQIPNGYGLSGTPLNETLVSLHQIIPQFQKNHDLQKVQCVILTDGEQNHLPYCKPWVSMNNGEEAEKEHLIWFVVIPIFVIVRQDTLTRLVITSISSLNFF